MAVDEHVDTLHLLQQVDGAVARGLVVNAQVAQADHIVAALSRQGVLLLLGTVVQILAGQEGHALDLGGVGLGGGLRSVQAEHADLGAVGRGEHQVVLKGHTAVVQDVGIHDGKVGIRLQILEVLVAVVELMVAQADHIVAGQVHQLHGGGTLRRADGGIALDKVAGVHQQDVGAAGLVGVLQGRHLGIAGNGAVDVVGVQDDDVAVQILGRLLRRIGGDSQGERHDHRHQQGQDFLFHSFTSSILWKPDFHGMGIVYHIW